MTTYKDIPDLTAVGSPSDIISSSVMEISISGTSFKASIAQLGTVFGGGSGGGQALVNINPQTGSYTLQLSDFPTDGTTTDIQITDASASVLTIPPHSSVASPIGSQGMVSQWGAGAVTVTAGAGVTLVDAWGAATTAQYDTRYFRQVTTDVWQVL